MSSLDMLEKRAQTRSLVNQLVQNPVEPTNEANVNFLKARYPKLTTDEIRGFAFIAQESVGMTGRNLSIATALFDLLEVLRDNS